MTLAFEHHPRRRRKALLLLVMLALVCLWALPAAAQDKEFSFVVFGDTRSESFIAAGVWQSQQIRQMLGERYPAASPELFFDPQTGQLERLVEPASGKEGPTTYFYRDGWPWLGVRDGQVILRRQGLNWVLRRVLSEIKTGSAFALHTGDVMLWGHQGQDLDHNPGWQEFNDRFLSKLPPADAALGLPGRFFPALGNHEVWGDDDLAGVLSTMPYLTKLGFSKDKRIYHFDHGGCRFIFLDSGTYGPTGEGWFSNHPNFQYQMQTLTEWLNEAREKKIRNVFVVYHKPSFCLAGHGPLPMSDNPHPYLKPFARSLNIAVFNGHVHSTEIYYADGIRYLLLGGGGAPQKLKANPPPEGYPEERYWLGQSRVEEYNYLVTKVGPRGVEFTLHRFRPGDPLKPLDQVELYKN